MIRDPDRRGRALAVLFREIEPRLFADLVEADVLPTDVDGLGEAQARREWECFALYACVRGLVAAGGFNRETAGAIDALHEAVLDGWRPNDHAGETLEARRQLIADRYAEYGEIGQAGGKSGAATVTRRLGEAAARHMTASLEASPELAELVGTLHESLAEGSAETIRREE
jgi:hypothetical protein